MGSYSFYTNIICQNCLTKVSPIIDNHKEITHWSIDLENKNNPLTVHSKTLSKKEIRKIIESTGFSVLQSFWKDKRVWKRAGKNTLNCLIGCSIGDIGVLVYSLIAYPEMNMPLRMTLAIIAGLISSITLETFLLRKNEKMSLKQAFNFAMRMSFLSMIAMELAMNITDLFLISSVQNTTNILFWLAIIPSLVAGFIVPLPYNYYRLKKFNRGCH